MVRAVKVVPLAEDSGMPGPRSFGGGSTGSGKRGGLMGKVPSLVFDLEDLGGDGSQHPAEQPLDEASVAEVAQKLTALLEPWSEPGARWGRASWLAALGLALAPAAVPPHSSAAAWWRTWPPGQPAAAATPARSATVP